MPESQNQVNTEIPPAPSEETFALLRRDNTYDTLGVRQVYQLALDGSIKGYNCVYSYSERRWMYVDQVPGVASAFWKGNTSPGSGNVNVTAADIGIGDLFVFMIKWTVAAIPAVVVMGIIMFILFGVVSDGLFV